MSPTARRFLVCALALVASGGGASHAAGREGAMSATATAAASMSPSPSPAGSALPPPAPPLPAQLWWRNASGLHGAYAASVVVPPASQAPRAPLGSVWKLFAYAYLQSREAHEPPYQCAANERAVDDEYCCEPGGSIGRDDALARSCGPYFAPQRLRLDAADWQRFWRTQQAPAWLLAPAAWRPETEVAVPELLDALVAVPPPARQAARRALLPLALKEDGVVARQGSGPRFKTWSWHLGGGRIGGAAGWLADGTPFWFGGPGTSKVALEANAAWLAQTWSVEGLADVRPDASALAAQPCVDVTFFARYPLRAVTRGDGSAVAPGPLRGPTTLQFESGRSLAFDAQPPMTLAVDAGRPTITARMPLDAYVARVVDREGDAHETQAARALAVVARTWLLQNTEGGDGCRAVADDSRAQRVSPTPPTAAALAAAGFTTDLVLDARPVHYHLNRASRDTMSWQAAATASRSGMPWDAILRVPFPQASLVALDARPGCAALPDARQWLLDAQRRWREPLRHEPGFEPLDERLQVCQLESGLPHSDQRLLQIRVREWFTHEGRLTLLHEYLHLALRHHPHGQDDDYVERLARRLVDS
jgi:uncharacterized protein YfaQ (DUF2300 family)